MQWSKSIGGHCSYIAIDIATLRRIERGWGRAIVGLPLRVQVLIYQYMRIWRIVISKPIPAVVRWDNKNNTTWERRFAYRYRRRLRKFTWDLTISNNDTILYCYRAKTSDEGNRSQKHLTGWKEWWQLVWYCDWLLKTLDIGKRDCRHD